MYFSFSTRDSDCSWTEYTLLGFEADPRERYEWAGFDAEGYYAGPGAPWAHSTYFSFHPFVGWVAETQGGYDV